MQYFSAYFLKDARKWFSLQYNTRDKKQQQQKHIQFKKGAVSSIYPRFWTYRSYLCVTEKSSTYDVSFPQASISKNNSVSRNQLKGRKPKNETRTSFSLKKCTGKNKEDILCRVFRRTCTDAKELLKEKSFFILSFVYLSEFVIRQVQTNIC